MKNKLIMLLYLKEKHHRLKIFQKKKKVNIYLLVHFYITEIIKNAIKTMISFLEFLRIKKNLQTFKILISHLNKLVDKFIDINQNDVLNLISQVKIISGNYYF